MPIGPSALSAECTKVRKICCALSAECTPELGVMSAVQSAVVHCVWSCSPARDSDETLYSTVLYRVGKTHCQGHQDPSKRVSIFLGETEANLKMVSISLVSISRKRTVRIHIRTRFHICPHINIHIHMYMHMRKQPHMHLHIHTAVAASAVSAAVDLAAPHTVHYCTLHCTHYSKFWSALSTQCTANLAHLSALSTECTRTNRHSALSALDLLST